MSRPIATSDLSVTERTFVAAMTRLSFGRFEFLRITGGELILDPWPTTVRDVKFGCHNSGTGNTVAPEFELKTQVAELFEYTRDVDAGEIRILEVKNGLPFSMEIEHGHSNGGGCHHA